VSCPVCAQPGKYTWVITTAHCVTVTCNTNTNATFAADWHALTTGYDDTADLPELIHEMVVERWRRD
jgi:hypothetical protein